jgi:hypothetical protein
MNMNTKEISNLLVDYLTSLERNRSIILQNFYYKNYEMDVFYVSSNDYITEYEIKISKNDFKKDFKKHKTKHELTRQTGRTLIKEYKHEKIIEGNYNANRFYFVVPENLITIDDIPKQLGLIYFLPNKTFKLIKKADFIHKEKMSLIEYKKIATKLAYRENVCKKKLQTLIKK